MALLIVMTALVAPAACPTTTCEKRDASREAVAEPRGANPRTPCRSRICRARVAHRRCSQTHPRWCVLHVVYHQRVTGWRRAWLLRVPGCESGWNPAAYFAHSHNTATSAPLLARLRAGDVSTGLYAFKPSTWATTPYGRRSVFSAFWQPFAAAWMLGEGRAGEWACR